MPIVIAYDGITLVVNKNVKISNISTANLAAKSSPARSPTGRTWAAQDMKIVVVNRDEASGTYASFKDLVLPSPGKTRAYTKDAIVTKENGEVAAKVSTTPGSIGYVGMAFADEVEKAGGRRLMVNGIKDTIANVLSKKWPLSRAALPRDHGRAQGRIASRRPSSTSSSPTRARPSSSPPTSSLSRRTKAIGAARSPSTAVPPRDHRECAPTSS